MSDQGELAEHWSAPRDDASAHDDTDDAPTGPMPPVGKGKPEAERPPGWSVLSASEPPGQDTELSEDDAGPVAGDTAAAEHGADPAAFAAGESSLDLADSVTEGRVVFSTLGSERRVGSSVPGEEGARSGVCE